MRKISFLLLIILSLSKNLFGQAEILMEESNDQHTFTGRLWIENGRLHCKYSEEGTRRSTFAQEDYKAFVYFILPLNQIYEVACINPGDDDPAQLHIKSKPNASFELQVEGFNIRDWNIHFTGYRKADVHVTTDRFEILNENGTLEYMPFPNAIYTYLRNSDPVELIAFKTKLIEEVRMAKPDYFIYTKDCPGKSFYLNRSLNPKYLSDPFNVEVIKNKSNSITTHTSPPERDLVFEKSKAINTSKKADWEIENTKIATERDLVFNKPDPNIDYSDPKNAALAQKQITKRKQILDSLKSNRRQTLNKKPALTPKTCQNSSSDVFVQGTSKSIEKSKYSFDGAVDWSEWVTIPNTNLSFRFSERAKCYPLESIAGNIPEMMNSAFDYGFFQFRNNGGTKVSFKAELQTLSEDNTVTTRNELGYLNPGETETERLGNWYNGCTVLSVLIREYCEQK